MQAADPLPNGTFCVMVDFPLLKPGFRMSATVVAWSPVDELRRGDVAGLRLLDSPPNGAAPLVLTRSNRLTQDQLIMVGFPRGLELGSWIYGRRGGRVATGWVEILSEPGRESALEPGFSGAPVWVPELDAAIGMVAQRVRGAPPKIGYMITTDALLSDWPRLADVIERRPPFRALRPFVEDDAELFFGREKQAVQLSRLARETPVVCMVGPSGVGKSSLLHAGVFPLLANEPDQLVTALRPSDGSTPAHALAAAFDGLINVGSPTHERLDRIDGLVERMASGGVADIVATALARHGGVRLLVAIDQFEEIFDTPEPTQAAFAQVLLAAMDAGARWSVMLNLRDTFLGQTLSSSNPAVLELATGWYPFHVTALTPTQLRAAITGPLNRVGTVSYQDGLVERLLEDVRAAPSSLPLLQFALAELWARRRGGQLLHDAYDELGGVRGALAGYARDVWSGLDPRSQGDAARLLVQLVRPLPNSEQSVRRTAHRDELDDAQWAIAQRLAGTRLLVLRGAPRSGVELAHESLLEHWHKLHELVDQSRDFRLWQENLRQRIATWNAEEKAQRRLLSGLDLREAMRWAVRQADDLSVAELEFLALSRRRRRRRLSAAALVLVVLVTAVFITYRSTGRQRADLAAADLANEAGRLDGRDSYGAVQLALHAYRTNSGVSFKLPPHTYPGVDRLLPDYTQYRVDTSAPTPPSASGPDTKGSGVSRLADAMSGKVSADGTRVVTVNSALQVVLWTLDGDRVRAEPLTNLFNTKDISDTVTISRSGRYLAFEQSLWPPQFPTDAHAPVDQEGLPKTNPSDYHTCKPNSIMEAVTCLVVYDIDARRVVTATPLGGGFTSVSTVTIDPDDQVVAAMVPGSIRPGSVEASQNTLRRWDLRTGREWTPLRIPWRSWPIGIWLRPGGTSAAVWEAMPGPSGNRPDRFAVAIDDFGSVPSHRELAEHTLDTAVSLDWRTVATVEIPPDESSFGVTVWDTRSGKVVTRIPGLSRAQGGYGYLALNRNGSEVVLSWYDPPEPSASTDIRQIARSLRQMDVWSIPDGAHQNVPEHIDSAWERVVPLGNSMNEPLALTRTSTVGLVLPRQGQAPPLRRMADATGEPPSLDNGRLMDRLCSLLADPNTDEMVRKLLPPDTSEEPPCPS
ncbi:Uncharacterised protein [Amycolatopsis camponoti]|uniref:Novel STAND NTPase 1 domain-containing protein n=1 Tax=Amycolatopsis camponoti TaxID=2606593 RepID=A0A6I8LKZ3_9PSEU|nr:Uncharacterised protein [Amycolatopsis camponoti]